jgi:hypothetical protein
VHNILDANSCEAHYFPLAILSPEVGELGQEVDRELDAEHIFVIHRVAINIDIELGCGQGTNGTSM